MQCVLYVHNHPAWGDRPEGRVCGMAVGENPVAHRWDPDRPLGSFVELWCGDDVDDPATEATLAVAKAFALAAAAAPGTPVEYRTKRITLRLLLAPGFDDRRIVVEPLLQLARGLRVRDGRVVSVGNAGRPASDVRPSMLG